MGKKRKAAAKPAEYDGPREVSAADARLGHIADWRDVADSEDEHHMQQEEIALEVGSRDKRRKTRETEDEFLEPSDDEVLGYDDDSEEEEEDVPGQGEAAEREDSGSEAPAKQDEEDSGWWGSSKKDYYEADQIATEADALEEEKEARRIQQKRLQKMTDADFLDETEWLAAPEAKGDEDAVVEVLDDVELSPDMPPEEQYSILQARYPEFSYLVDEFQQLQTLLPEVQTLAHGQPSSSVAVAKYYVLGSLVAVLASYFALLTSPARDAAAGGKALSPAELRNHQIMETLLECRAAWLKIKDMKAPVAVPSTSGLPSPLDEETQVVAGLADERAHRRTDTKKPKKAKKSAEAKRKEKELEASIAELDSLLTKTGKKASRAKPATPTAARASLADDDRSDFGEEEVMDVREGEEKAARKKSLRFYTSQIVQKSNRRVEGAKNAGGDDDLPYRERLKDRQARLQAEAERRGQRGSKFGADLDPDGASDGEDAAVAGTLRAEEDEYYDLMANNAAQRKDAKAQRHAAIAAAGKQDRVVRVEQLAEDGKRKISYAIEKNKGLTPRRKKEVKNPRVKKREQFKKKQQKLRSVKPIYGGGEGRGGYAGETTGIKAGLIKSVKL